MLASNVAGTLLLRRVVERPGPLAGSAVALASTAAAVEVFAWCERNSESRTARAIRRPGFEIQRVVGTREPDERQLEVGRAALAEILRVEQPPAGWMDADVIVVGAGLAGLVATAELADAGRRVILLDQEPEASFGGQAFWSLGGLMFVDSPEQRRMRVKDSYELALQDWLGTAGFDRPEDEWPRRWAEAYVGFCAGEKRAWLHAQGMRWLPNPGWPERGGYLADGHGNSVPRFHITWGTGPGRRRAVRAARARGGRARARRAALPPPRGRARHRRRRRDGRGGHGARAERRQARRGQRPRARPGSSRSPPRP